MKRVYFFLSFFLLLTACSFDSNQSGVPSEAPALNVPHSTVEESPQRTSKNEVISPELTAAPETQVSIPTAAHESQPTPPASPTQTEPTAQGAQLTPQPVVFLPSGSVLQFSTLTMFDSERGWAIGGESEMFYRVFTTLDGGLTWREVTPPEPRLGQAGSWSATGVFLDPDQALVIFQSAPYWEAAEGIHSRPVVTWYTRNGGVTWQPSQALDVSGLDETFTDLSLEWIDPENAWLLAHVGAGMNHDYIALFRTGDGGVTWERLLDPYNDGGIQACRKTGMDFVNAQEGWLTGTCNGVAAGTWFYRTLDGGRTWQLVEIPEPRPGIFSEIVFECATESPNFFPGPAGHTEKGFVVLSCRNQETGQATSYLYSTRNGGVSWSRKDYPGGKLILQDPTHGWALGQTIYSTSDGGATFVKQSVVTWQANFTFVGRDLVWAAARSDGAEFGLVRSLNGGARWELLQPVVK